MNNSRMVNSQLPEPLSASNKNSFAYKTIKDRLPVTITKVIDFIHRYRNELTERYSQDCDADIKASIERLSQLRYELTTDKPFKQFEDKGQDVDLWNSHLEKLKATIGEENCSWFKAPWLFSECYMYRRVREIMLLCQTGMSEYDPFEKVKIEACELNKRTVSALIRSLCPLDYENEKNDTVLQQKRFHTIIQALLWSNKNDLSLSSGEDVSSKVNNLVDLLESFEDCILSDHSVELWDYLKKCQIMDNKTKRIDIVLDNCSIELASDLILCDFLLRNNFVDQIYLHAKAYYWFISDVTEFDFNYLLKQFQSENSIAVNKFQQRLNSYLAESKLIFLNQSPFWNLAYSLHDFEAIQPESYNEFKEKSLLVILKGDLNYRKLLGDLNWPFNVPLSEAVQGFKPTSVCAIRTLKSDLIANLNINEEENKRFSLVKQKFKDNDKWMISGDYGLIQFSNFNL